MENKNVGKVLDELKTLPYELENFKNQFQYVSVLICDFLKNKYKETYNSLMVLKNLDMVMAFAKSNKIKPEAVENFLSLYDNLGDLIDEHNKKSVSNKVENKQTNLVSVNGTDVAKIVVDAYREISHLYLYGSAMLINVLKGNRPRALVDSGFEKCVYFGALKDVRTADISEILNILIKDGIINKTEGMYPVLSISEEKDVSKIGKKACSQIENIVQMNFKSEKRTSRKAKRK